VQNVSKHFVRDEHGAWTCISTVDLDGPSGRIQVPAGARFAPGTVFMGLDMARWLEKLHNETSGRPRPGP